jgi:hypothetical protein
MEFRFGFAPEEGTGDAAAAQPAAPTFAPSQPPAAAAQPAPPPPLQWVSPPPAALAPALHVLEAAPGLRRVVVDADAVTGVARDVVSGRYEGGAKVWECTRDLLSYLRDDSPGGGAALLARPGCVVADVGCGAGLLGVAALQAGVSHVLFADHDAGVLAGVTAPNVGLNCGGGGFDRCSFLAGPWAAVNAAAAAAGATAADDADNESRRRLRRLQLGRVDVVLASEVLYNLAYHGDLAALLRALLVPGSGVALVATKRYYYGAELGGGTDSFTATATAPPHCLRVERLREYADGASMTRDLLRITAPPLQGGGSG